MGRSVPSPDVPTRAMHENLLARSGVLDRTKRGLSAMQRSCSKSLTRPAPKRPSQRSDCPGLLHGAPLHEPPGREAQMDWQHAGVGLQVQLLPEQLLLLDVSDPDASVSTTSTWLSLAATVLRMVSMKPGKLPISCFCSSAMDPELSITNRKSIFPQA